MDLKVRQALNSKLIDIGTGVGNKKQLDLTVLGISGLDVADIQIVGGEKTTEPLLQDREWIESFLVKGKPEELTGKDCGFTRSSYVYTIWVKTRPEFGTYYCEGVSGLIQEHFKHRERIQLSDGTTLRVLSAYQQPSVVIDNNSTRLFNRVFVECEAYHRNVPN